MAIQYNLLCAHTDMPALHSQLASIVLYRIVFFCSNPVMSASKIGINDQRGNSAAGTLFIAIYMPAASGLACTEKSSIAKPPITCP